MTADTTAEEEAAAAAENSTTDETTTSTTTTTTTPPIVSVSNRLFLSHIDYTNHDGEENGKNKKNTNTNVNTNANANANSSCEEDLTTLELSPQTVKQRLEELFSKFGSVQEIYLSDKDKTKTKTKSKSKSVGENQKHDQEQEQERPPFAFIAMETAEEARAALNGLGLVTTGGGGQTQTQAASESARRLFRDLAPAKVHKSKKNKQNKSDRLRSERLQEYRQRLALVVAVAAAKDGSGTGTSTDTGKANATANENANATAKPVANVVCQVHTSHLDRLRDFASEQEGVDLVGSYSAQKGTSFVMLRASDNDNHNDNHNDNDGDDAPERLSRKLWDTWYVAPNLNRVTVLDHYSDSTTSANNNNNNNNNTGTSSTSTPVVVEGNLRNGVVPAIVKSLSQLGTRTRTRTGTTKDAVRLRLAVYPPKLQRTLLDALDNYTRTRTREAAKAKQDGNGKQHQHQHQHHPEIELSPGNPTHTISIIQLHPGVVVTPKSKGDNDKALYVLGRLESVPPTRKRSLDNDDDDEDDGNDDNSNSNININNNKYQLQQQSTSLVPQPKRRYKNKDPMIPSATGTLPLRPLAAGDPTNDDDDNDENEADNNDNDNDKSISRAYWKLQEAWERYEHGAPCLDRARARGSDSNNNDDDNNNNNNTTKMMWALDCGAAPGGWTKFLFRPGVVERIYAVDPGELSPDVVPGLDDRLRRARNNNDNNDSPSPPPVVRHVVSTIQAALPSLVSDLATATAIETETETATETPPTTSASATTTTTTTTTTTKRVLDVWVSDMCVKDVRGQIDALLAARDACVVGPGTFFVLTLKCVVGYSAKAFEYQTNEQVARLSGISRDVQVVHLFSNRSSERTVIGYLI